MSFYIENKFHTTFILHSRVYFNVCTFFYSFLPCMYIFVFVFFWRCISCIPVLSCLLNWLILHFRISYLACLFIRIAIFRAGSPLWLLLLFMLMIITNFIKPNFFTIFHEFFLAQFFIKPLSKVTIFPCSLPGIIIIYKRLSSSSAFVVVNNVVTTAAYLVLVGPAHDHNLALQL